MPDLGERQRATKKGAVFAPFLFRDRYSIAQFPSDFRPWSASINFESGQAQKKRLRLSMSLEVIETRFPASVARMSESDIRGYPGEPAYRCAHAGFCNGPGLVNPFLRHPLAGHLLLYGIGARPSPDGIHERSRSANLRKRDHIVGCVDNPHGGLT